MKQALQLRMSQHLALTPQLQQSIRLLQLSTLELNQEIEQLLADNPLLERADSPFDSSLRLAGDGSVQSGPEQSFDSGSGEHQGEDSTKSPADEHRDESPVDLGHDLLMGEPRTRGALDDDSEPPQVCGVSETLREHLLSQLSTTKAAQRDRALVAVLIDAIDEDGYLRTPLEEISELLPEELEVTVEELATALCLLQSFDPPGVGARNAAECLSLQLRDTTLHAVAASDAVVRRNALTLASQYLDILAQRDFTKLKRLLKTDDAGLRAAHALLLRLDPYPGRRFGHHASNFIVADVIVKKRKGVWTAMLNPEVMPQLRINRVYAQILREHRGNEQVASLSTRLQEARWLIKNVQQRFETILRVAQAIVERQRNFFTHGEVAMRPLVLREIADTLGLHESTISRVTTQKYMLTPLGTFELKYFFGSHVATDAGGAASSTAIRALIKQLIGAEDPKKTPVGQQDRRIAWGTRHRRRTSHHSEVSRGAANSSRKPAQNALTVPRSGGPASTSNARLLEGVLMNLTISGHHLEVTPAIREYAMSKISRVTRHFDHVIDITVLLSVEKLQQKAEINLHLRGKDIHCEAIDANLYTAIDCLIDKLDRQVIKYKECMLARPVEGAKRQAVA